MAADGSNLGRDLAGAEPLMVIGRAVGQIGQTARDIVEPSLSAAQRYLTPTPKATPRDINLPPQRRRDPRLRTERKVR